MREIFTSGSAGRALGNQCLYPETDRCPHAMVEFRASSTYSAIVEFIASVRAGNGG